MFLQMLASASVAGAAPPPHSLRAVAGDKGLLAGTCVSRRELGDDTFKEVLARECSIVVCENDMKWANIHPRPAVYDFAGGDLLMNFAEAHGQKLRGHNLCWHQQTPTWLDSTLTPQNAEGILRLHIATVAGHYKGRIHSWDVVNEAINVGDNPAGYRNSIWYQNLGPRYLEIAFRAAADADPHAILTYNDYDLEQDGEPYKAKRAAALTLLRSLRDKNVPLQALGLQAHLKAGATPDNWQELHAFLRQVEQLDLQVFITELDVNDRELPGDVAERDQAVATLYFDFLSNVLQHNSVRAILTWGLTDRDTWLTGFERRKDGLPQRPLPFDPDLQPAPAYTSLLRVIGQAPART